MIKSEHGKTFGGYSNLNWNIDNFWNAGEVNHLFSTGLQQQTQMHFKIE